MKLSIFTTATNPSSRGDLEQPAMKCYTELADEIVYVDGSGDLPNDNITKHNETTHGYRTDLKELHYKWPKEFSWEFIGQQFQRGYEACTGDWVIHADLDFIFHERDFRAIRMACENNPDVPA